MRYKVFFMSGESCFISEERYLGFLLNKPINHKPVDDLLKYPFINERHVTHVLPENEVPDPGVVVTPPTPEAVREAKAKKHDETISSPDAIIAGVKEKQDEGSDQ